jgi:hypothetical protein
MSINLSRITKVNPRDIWKHEALDFYRNNGIPSEDVTHEKIGQTSLIFTNWAKPPIEDDSLEASIRYLKFKRF